MIEFIKIDYNDRDGKYLSLTKKRFEILKNSLEKSKKYKNCVIHLNDPENNIDLDFQKS